MDFTVTTRQTPLPDVPALAADVIADLTALAPIKRGQQANTDFPDADAAKLFANQVKVWAAENGYRFTRVGPSANLGIKDLPTRVSFTLTVIKAPAEVTPETTTNTMAA